MTVIPQTRPEATPLPGIHHSTWAGADDGLQQLSLWRQSLEPGAATPPHRHDCEEVVLVDGGQGALVIDGVAHPFAADSTLVIPPNVDHQIVNTGTVPLACTAAFSVSPVAVFLPDGQALDLPWES